MQTEQGNLCRRKK